MAASQTVCLLFSLLAVLSLYMDDRPWTLLGSPTLCLTWCTGWINAKIVFVANYKCSRISCYPLSFFRVILGSRNTKYFNLHIEAKWSYRRLCSLIGILMSPYLKPQMNFRRWNQTKGEVYRRSCLQEPPSGLLSSWYPGRNSKYILCNKEFWWGRHWYSSSGYICASWVTSRRDQSFCAQGAVTILISVFVTCAWNRWSQERSGFAWNVFSLSIPREVARLFLFYLFEIVRAWDLSCGGCKIVASLLFWVL